MGKRQSRNYKEFKEVFLQIGDLTRNRTAEDIDISTGILIGITQEKAKAGKITKKQCRTLADLIKAEWQRAHDVIEAKQAERAEWEWNPEEEEAEDGLVYYDFASAAAEE